MGVMCAFSKTIQLTLLLFSVCRRVAFARGLLADRLYGLYGRGPISRGPLRHCLCGGPLAGIAFATGDTASWPSSGHAP